MKINGDLLIGDTNKNLTGLVEDRNYLGLSLPNKTYATGSWSTVNITPDLTQQVKLGNGISFSNNRIQITSSAKFRYIELSIYLKWLFSWTTDAGNRGIYLYKNGERIYMDYNSCPSPTSSWYSDTYTWLINVSPGDYIEIYIVRGGQYSNVDVNVEHGQVTIIGIPNN